MRIAMIGTGYVGLVSGACFSDFGHDVTCVDKDAALIEPLPHLILPIFEPALFVLLFLNVAAFRLSFASDLAPSLPSPFAFFFPLSTPFFFISSFSLFFFFFFYYFFVVFFFL